MFATGTIASHAEVLHVQSMNMLKPLVVSFRHGCSIAGVLSYVLSLMICNAAALVSGDDYVAYNQQFAIVNITYHNAAMDAAYSEVSFLFI